MRNFRDGMRRQIRRAGAGLRGAWTRLRRFIRRHGGRIAYYACVALVLSAIAYAAEQYRSEQAPAVDALILPAADVEISAPVEAEPLLTLPENAQRLRGFAQTPEWNAALKYWEAHMGVDYRLEENAVHSLSAGVVRTVGESGVYGGFVEVECGEYLLRYASVAADGGVRPGTELARGDRIGTADASMPGEAQQGAHLHLELTRMGEAVDFEAHAEK